jgi:hypothetical protein
MKQQAAVCDCHGAPTGDGARLCTDGTDDLRELLGQLTAAIFRADREPKRGADGLILPHQAGRLPSSRWDTPSGELANLPRMLAEAAARQVVLGGQVRIRHTKTVAPLPLDPAASDMAARLQAVVGHYGGLLMDAGAPGPARPGWAEVAEWLVDKVGLIRGQEWAGVMLADVTRVVRDAQRRVDRLPDRAYLGLCGASITVAEGSAITACDWPLYAAQGAATARCRCGTSVDVGERRQELLDKADELRLTAVEIERLTTTLGRRIPRTSVTSWASRGQLEGDGADPPRFVLHAAQVLAERASARRRSA